MKKALYHTAGALALSATLALSGCGGGGGGTTAAAVDTSGGGGTTLTGMASKGPLSGATVTAYKITSAGGEGDKLGETTTNGDGDYTLNVDYTGGVLIKVTGGTYIDEATGDPKTIPADAPLRVATTAAAGSNTIAVTPLTEVAVKLAGTLTSENIIAANAKVSNIVQANIVTTQPADATNATEYGAATTEQKNYALMLATISQYAKNGGNKTIAAVVDELSTDLTDAQADKLDATGTALLTATSNFIETNARNQTGKTTASDTTLYEGLVEAKNSGVSGTAFALKVAEKVSVVEATDTASSGRLLTSRSGMVLQSAVLASTLPLDADFHVDKTTVYMDDETTDAFESVNEILCMMGQTRYDKMLNQGAYRAQVDVAQCESERGDVSQAQESSSNQTSGANMPEYEYWTVESTRVDNSSPQIVKAWIHESGDEDDMEPDMLIMAKVEITEGKSDTNPYGLFAANFVAYPVINGTPDLAHGQFKGFLKTEKNADGKVAFKYAEQGSFSMGDVTETFSQLSSFTRSADGATGDGTVQIFEAGPWIETPTHSRNLTYNFAFNADKFHRKDATGEKEGCLSRTQFNDVVWRYGLYKADDAFAEADRGDRVTLDSGFPIKYGDFHGWAGYWGVWLPNEANLPTSGTVNVSKETYGPDGGTSTPYTLEIIGGKLVRHTRKVLTLTDIKNITMEYWDNATGYQYRVEWDGTQFKKTSQLSPANQATWTWTDATGNVDLTSLQWPELNFWSQALGGSVRIRFEDPTAGPDGLCAQAGGVFNCSAKIPYAQVVFYSQETVYPGAVAPGTLACLENCPEGAKINTTTPPTYADSSWQNPENLNFQQAAPAAADRHNYTYTGNVLKDGATPLLMTATPTGGDGMYQFGFNSGPMFEPTEANLNKLKCDWDPTGNSTCGWQAWNLDVYYTWETGPNQWNKLTILRDGSGTVAEFDPPLMVTYQVPTTVPAGIPSKLAGTKFQLDYQGFGELHGIPGVCFNRETGQEANCGPGMDWRPQFSIPSGAQVTDATGKTYLIKALEKGQRMQKLDNSECSALPTTGQTLPSMSTWVDPALGTEPTVTAPPAVIGGVLQ